MNFYQQINCSRDGYNHFPDFYVVSDASSLCKDLQYLWWPTLRADLEQKLLQDKSFVMI